MKKDNTKNTKPTKKQIFKPVYLFALFPILSTVLYNSGKTALASSRVMIEFENLVDFNSGKTALNNSISLSQFENLVDFNSGKTSDTSHTHTGLFENLVDFNSGKTTHINNPLSY